MAQGVEFEEDSFSYKRPSGTANAGNASGYSMNTGYGMQNSQGPKGMVGWLIRHHLAKSEKSAQVVMIGLVVINIIITVIVIKFFT